MGGRGGALGSAKNTGSATVAPAASGPPPGKSFPDMTVAQQQALLQMQRAKQDSTTLKAIHDYIDPRAEANGFGRAQNLNHALENGQTINAAQQAIVTGLNKLMQPIGSEVTLYRGDHDAILKKLGIPDYTQLTTAQLRQAVVGRTLTTKGFMSTTHTPSLSPFLPGGQLGGGREVIMKIHTAKTTKTALIQRAQGEVLLNTGTHMRITGVRPTGAYARPRASMQRKPVIEIEVEVW